MRVNYDNIQVTKPYPVGGQRIEFRNAKTGRVVTDFQFKVYDLCAQIPKGYVSTYKLISDALSSSPRAVGGALRVNPFAPFPVPCHRVISSNYFIGGFDGEWGTGEKICDKREKLAAEGITFDEQGYLSRFSVEILALCLIIFFIFILSSVILKDTPLEYRHYGNSIKTQSYARVGIMGNPSDGFYGQTISMLINNFSVELTLLPNEFANNPKEYQVINFQSSETGQVMYTFPNMNALITTSSSIFDQDNQGSSLLWATCKVFHEYCKTHDIPFLGENNNRGFTISFKTTIPRQVGLGGSSAIITAFWKALMIFYGVSRNQISLEIQASLVLAVEKDVLGIFAGLQDRVIQTFGGLMFMDFGKEYLERQGFGKYERISHENLPPGLWLAYETKPSDSGKIHSEVRTRWEAGDAQVISAMHRFAEFAKQAKEILSQRTNNTQQTRNHARKELARLMNENFSLRRELYGDHVLGPANLFIIEISRIYGFAAKLTGSGEREGFAFEWIKIQLLEKIEH
ncbi:11166_t:CDS:2 [Ambispora leptoticha]|uniref:Methylated-DNA--protein-cysteine methyltransferase n=1 Tax=Ambispora leptoticha TaxID=144679 RepID=A0A9N9DIB6_9GLOM|nr:11166_t:CDS:2 [Ambispora leptoticha]